MRGAGGGGCPGFWVSQEQQGAEGMEINVPVLAFAWAVSPAQPTQTSPPLGSLPDCPRAPKDSVLITGLISMYLISTYPSASPTLKNRNLGPVLLTSAAKAQAKV